MSGSTATSTIIPYIFLYGKYEFLKFSVPRISEVPPSVHLKKAQKALVGGTITIIFL